MGPRAFDLASESADAETQPRFLWFDQQFAIRLRRGREEVDDMTHAAPAPLIGREFDSFLFAPIGDDGHGQPLSVLSALARSDVDPWEEAGALARMPRKKAKARLTALIVALPDEPIAALRLDAIASDLVALLPRANNFVPRPQSDVRRSENAQAWLGLSVLVVLTAMALIISAPQSQRPGPSTNSYASTANGSMRPVPPVAHN